MSAPPAATRLATRAPRRLSAAFTRLSEPSEARDRLERWTGRLPSLILLRLRPGKPGDLDVLRWIRGQPRLKHVPVVVLAPPGDGCELREARRLGANDCVLLPPEPEAVARVVRALAGFWSLNEAPGGG